MSRVRAAAFEFLRIQKQLQGDVLDRAFLIRGFEIDGQRVPLMSPQAGIFRPKSMDDEAPLSILTAPEITGKPRPYDDRFVGEGLLTYRYRGQDPTHRDNAGLRYAFRQQLPLIYLVGIVPGRYMPLFPVYLVDDDPSTLSFTVAVDDVESSSTVHAAVTEAATQARRAYITTTVRKRLHQELFRERVIAAYQRECSVCHLRHAELLDAAHILPDGHPRGDPVIPNGLALCKLHHAAFDLHILRVRPDYTIEVRGDILEEIDGPMLRHGLQGVHGASLIVPKNPAFQPDRVRLGERYELIRSAG